MKHARGQNKLFQNVSLLMRFCNFEIFLNFKDSIFVRHVIALMSKDQISPGHSTRNTNESGAFTSKPFF